MTRTHSHDRRQGRKNIELIRQILHYAQHVNVQSKIKLIASENILIASKKCSLEIINDFEKQPEFTVINRSERKIGQPYKIFGSGIKKHILIPIEFDDETDCYKCVASQPVACEQSGKQAFYILINKHRLINDYSLRNAQTYLDYSRLDLPSDLKSIEFEVRRIQLHAMAIEDDLDRFKFVDTQLKKYFKAQRNMLCEEILNNF